MIRTLAAATWPADEVPTPIAGFVSSSFSPLAAAVAERCLAQVAEPQGRTALILVSASGDLGTAVNTVAAVDAGKRISPLLFFQSVPNAVAGHIAARWGLTGPVVCLSPTQESTLDGLELAELLIEDGDADRALVISVEQEPDSAEAVLVCGGES